MSSRAIRVGCLVVSSILSGACGGGDSPDPSSEPPADASDTGVQTDAPPLDAPQNDSADGPVQKNACGGTQALQYDGGPATPGAHCGVCNDGLLACATVDSLQCQGATDDCLQDGGTDGAHEAAGDAAQDALDEATPDALVADAASEEGGEQDAEGQDAADGGSADAGADAVSEDASIPPDAAKNECGGYSELLYNGQPPVLGSLCGGCNEGTVACTGQDSVACVGADPSCGVPEGGLPDGATDASQEPTVNGCGGTMPLQYQGQPATVGQSCGVCNDGTLQCSGLNSLLCLNASSKNGCGTCGALAGEPGSSCGAAGEVWNCTTSATVECAVPKPPPTNVTASNQTYSDYIRVGWTGAPNATGYVIRRDGKDVGQVLASKSSYDDASVGTLGTPLMPTGVSATTGDPEKIVVSWKAPMGSGAGPLLSYTVLAVYGTILSVPSAAANGARAPSSAAAVNHYTIMRGNALLAQVPASQTSYEDFTAPAGVPAAPAGVTASIDQTNGVQVTWNASAPSPGANAAYAITACPGDDNWGCSGPYGAIGSRAASPVLGYAISKDGKNWQSVGPALNWFDGNAPLGGFTLNVSMANEGVSGPVRFFVKSSTTGAPGQPYRVRAQSMYGAGASSFPANGRRAMGTASYQWQRSSGDADSSYADLPNETGQRLIDPITTTLTGGRYYRVVARAEGATDTTSTGLRGVSPKFKQVSGGWPNVCALRVDGTVACWGSQHTVPSSLSSVVFSSISTGWLHACGIRADDGKVMCWGDNASYQAPPGPSADSFKAIAAGHWHTCGIRMDDKLVCWGSNSIGEGPPGPSVDAFKAVGAGRNYTCGIRADDKLLCWGTNNAYKQAPPGPSMESFKAIATGFEHTCGILLDDTVKCFGMGDYGEITPPAGTFKTIATGFRHTCATRLADDKLVCWGKNSAGEAPIGPTEESYLSIAAGGPYDTTYATNHPSSGFTCGIRTDGSLTCLANPLVPAAPPDYHLKALANGPGHACAIQADDKVVCWGYNAFGAAPAGPSADSFKAIAAGGWYSGYSNASGAQHTCGIRLSDDRVVCWGSNGKGQAPPGPSADAFKAISAGAEHTCGIRLADDKVMCWGFNGPGQAPPGPSADTFAAIDAGAAHTCGILLADGRVVCWGDNTDSQAPTTPSTDSFKAISAGGYYDPMLGGFVPKQGFTCGIRIDDKVVCWGANNNLQAPTTPSADSFKSLSAGPNHACGVRADDKVVCWGANWSGASPAAPSLDTFLAVQAGYAHSCGILSGGGLVCWGSNSFSVAPTLPFVFPPN